ncbi:MAG: glycosyltransferase [Flavobacteriales bacterium]|nr:glycosyltransferase [Flavobacteriales bacterium]
MHILFIPSWFKTRQNPFYATFIDEQARMMQKKGFQVGVLFPMWNGRFSILNYFEGNKVHAYHTNDFPVLELTLRSKAPGYTQMNFNGMARSIVRAYDRYCQQFGSPDLAHAHCVFMGGFGASVLLAKRQLSYVITEHASSMVLQYPRQHSYERFLIEKVYHDAATVIPVSTFLGAQLKNLYKLNPERVKVVPNVLAPMFELPPDPVPSVPPVRLIYVAEFSPNKNHLLLLRTFRELLQRTPLHLTLIGKGPERERILRYIRDVQLQDHVEIFAEMSHEDVRVHLEQSHIVVSTSSFETFGLNVLEGLAMERQVVAMDSGGPGDFSGDSNLVLVKDENDYAAALQKAIDNVSAFDGRSVRKHMMERFSESRVSTQLAEVYMSALKG